MIEIRKLELDEWPEDAALRSDQAICIAAIKGEKIVGRIFLTSIIHMEGIEIDEAERNSTLMGRLVEEAEKEAKTLGISTLLAFSANPLMEDYIYRLGYNRMPWSVWSRSLCQSEA